MRPSWFCAIAGAFAAGCFILGSMHKVDAQATSIPPARDYDHLWAWLQTAERAYTADGYSDAQLAPDWPPLTDDPWQTYDRAADMSRPWQVVITFDPNSPGSAWVAYHSGSNIKGGYVSTELDAEAHSWLLAKFGR